jgi:hypothetical protein
MRIALSATLLTALLCGCASLRVGDTAVYGHTEYVSVEDIRAAIAAYRTSRYASGNPPRAEVISRTEIRVYFDRVGDNCMIVRRIHGRWQNYEVVLVTS